MGKEEVLVDLDARHGVDDGLMAHLPRRPLLKIVTAACIVVLLGGLWWLLAATGGLAFLSDVEALRRWIDGLGPLGPLAVIGLLTANIVASPLPGGPVLVAAGAAYGPFWAALYGLIGIEIGSLIAFLLARVLGADVVRRWIGERAARRLEGYEMTLMAIVFVSRLIPIISFDVVSYAMGLTPLRLWRFALANLAGIVPMTVLLVLVGDGIVTADATSIGLALAAMFVMTLAAIAIVLWMRRGAPDSGSGAASEVKRALEETEP
jgi:uncharacterized membrane protein YdjX (TVP38/TMEM64 family)